MIEQPDDERLEQLLADLGPADPPPDLVSSVMARVTPLDAARTDSGTPLPGGRIMKRKVLWAFAAAAVVALAVFAVKGFPPVDRGIEGTVGAAKRYQAPQLADSDVAVNTTQVEEFLQSETSPNSTSRS